MDQKCDVVGFVQPRVAKMLVAAFNIPQGGRDDHSSVACIGDESPFSTVFPNMSVEPVSNVVC